VGLLPALDVQTLALAPLEPQGRYALVAEAGLRAVPAAERASLSGAQWLRCTPPADGCLSPPCCAVRRRGR
jgi:DNA repair protein RecO (recombination protein O)